MPLFRGCTHMSRGANLAPRQGRSLFALTDCFWPNHIFCLRGNARIFVFFVLGWFSSKLLLWVKDLALVDLRN